MKNKIFLFAFLIPFLFSCNGNHDAAEVKKDSAKEISCKLTTPELMERKATVLAAIKQEVLEKKELPDGYSFKFNGSDTLFDQLSTFIRSERHCCDFFTFTLRVSDSKSFIWLDITGTEGTKDFVKGEMEM